MILKKPHIFDPAPVMRNSFQEGENVSRAAGELVILPMTSLLRLKKQKVAFQNNFRISLISKTEDAWKVMR